MGNCHGPTVVTRPDGFDKDMKFSDYEEVVVLLERRIDAIAVASSQLLEASGATEAAKTLGGSMHSIFSSSKLPPSARRDLMGSVGACDRALIVTSLATLSNQLACVQACLAFNERYILRRLPDREQRVMRKKYRGRTAPLHKLLRKLQRRVAQLGVLHRTKFMVSKTAQTATMGPAPMADLSVKKALADANVANLANSILTGSSRFLNLTSVGTQNIMDGSASMLIRDALKASAKVSARQQQRKQLGSTGAKGTAESSITTTTATDEDAVAPKVATSSCSCSSSSKPGGKEVNGTYSTSSKAKTRSGPRRASAAAMRLASQQQSQLESAIPEDTEVADAELEAPSGKVAEQVLADMYGRRASSNMGSMLSPLSVTRRATDSFLCPGDAAGSATGSKLQGLNSGALRGLHSGLRARGQARRIGKYELHETIGKGSYGKVKRAIDTETGQEVAIKFLDWRGYDRVSRKYRNLHREIAVLSRLNHANVSKLLEVNWAVDYPCKRGGSKVMVMMVMELAAGGDLIDTINRAGGFTETVTRTLFGQLINALAHCHAHGVSHRDIKPDNLLLTRRTGSAAGATGAAGAVAGGGGGGGLPVHQASDCRLVLADFGLCSWDHAVDQHMLRTPCGTSVYIAPEVNECGADPTRSRRYDGEAADMWMAGIMLFIMLTGRPALGEAVAGDWHFDCLRDRDFRAFWDAHEQHRRPGRPLVSDHAKSLIERLLAVNPVNRASIADVRLHPWFISQPSMDNAALELALFGNDGPTNAPESGSGKAPPVPQRRPKPATVPEHVLSGGAEPVFR